MNVLNNYGFQEYTGVVYKYTLSIPEDFEGSREEDNYVYIGCTTEENRRRYIWNSTMCNYAGSKISEARKKYGLNNFKYEVIETVTDTNIIRLKQTLEHFENKYIVEYDSCNNGFNGNLGGAGFKGVHLSEETKAKMSAAKKGVKKSEETKKHMKESQQKRGVRVIAIFNSITKKYNTIQDAAKQLDINPGSIEYSLRNNKACKKGILFKFA